MLLQTQKEYYDVLIAVAKNYEHGIITSFGVFCGITFDFDCSKTLVSDDRRFLDSVANHQDLTVVVGTNGYYSPKKTTCKDCLLAYSKRNIRIEKHRELFPNIHWKFLRSLHSKVAVFWGERGKIAVIGSRNFTGSDNIELSIVVRDAQTAGQLVEYCQNIVKLSTDVNLDNLIMHSIDETGSDTCIKLLYDEI